MALFIVLLILALIVFGVGFAVHLLWWLLIILLVIAILDTVAKVVYGYMAVVSDTKATDRDLAETPASTTPLRRAA